MAQPRKRNGNNNRQITDDDTDDDTGGGNDGEFNEAQINRITGIVNAAVSGQLQRKLPNAISSAITGPLGELRTLIEGQGARGRGTADDDDDEEEAPAPKGKKGKRTVEADPEKEQMKQRLAAIENERKQEREQNRNRERDGQLREHLTKLGVDANRMRGAIAVLRESTKYDEATGEWSYKAKRDGYEEELDIAAGAKEWAGTDEGKSYIAPSGQAARGGSGTRMQTGAAGGGGGGGTPRSGQPVADPKAAKAQAKQAAVAALGQAVNELGGGVIGIG